MLEIVYVLCLLSAVELMFIFVKKNDLKILVSKKIFDKRSKSLKSNQTKIKR